MAEINKSEPNFVEEAGWKEFQNAVNIYFPMGKCAPGDRCIASVRVAKPKLLLLALSYWFVYPTGSKEKDSDKHAIKSTEDCKWENKDLSFKDAHLCTSNLKWNDFYELHKQSSVLRVCDKTSIETNFVRPTSLFLHSLFKTVLHVIPRCLEGVPNNNYNMYYKNPFFFMFQARYCWLNWNFNRETK